MRISDWSSDVCSSDLAGKVEPVPLNYYQTMEPAATPSAARRSPGRPLCNRRDRLSHMPGSAPVLGPLRDVVGPAHVLSDRSEERRVGKECVSTCRSGWSP